MMKIFNYILVISIMLFSSCTPEEKDLFGDLSSNRMNERLKADKAVLVGAENGWLMEYYPADQMIYGGYNLFVSFAENEMATVSGDIAGVGKKTTGMYKLKDSAGPILSFDTYNEIFHFFSEPKNSLGIGSNGKGMEGDFEFRIMEATPEKVILKGKKTGNMIVMTPIRKGVEWDNVLKPITDMMQILSKFKMYEYVDGTFKADVSASYNKLTLTYDDNGNEKEIDAPYIVTASGCKFFSPLVLNGKSIDSLVYKPNSGSGILEGNNNSGIFTPIFPLNNTLISGDWFFSLSGMGAYGAVYWNLAKQTLVQKNITLNYAMFTPAAPGKLAFYWSASGYQPGYLVFNYTLIGDKKIKITFALNGNNIGVDFYQNMNFNRIIYPFSGGSSGKTFTLTADDINNPTVITMTDDSTPTNTIRLSKNEILNPLTN